MKKIRVIFLSVLFGSILFLLPTIATADSVNSIQMPEVSDTSVSFIEQDLVGTKIETNNSNSLISPRTGGYSYRYVSHSESNVKSTFLGKVTRTNAVSVSWGVQTKYGSITLGVSTSASRVYNEYRTSSTLKSTWRVYDKYSGNYIRSDTFTLTPTYLSYTRA